MTAAVLMLLAQAAMPPPLLVQENELRSVAAASWTCETSGPSERKLTLSGSFPAVSAEAQKDGGAFKLQATMRSTSNGHFSGSFLAALTSSVAGMTSYSILIPNVAARRAEYVLTFELYPASGGGFVNVTHFDESSGAPTAYVTGICKLQVAQ